jgi:ribonuclease HI
LCTAVVSAVQAVDCYRKALQAADNNNTEYAARVKALSKAIGKKAAIAKVQVRVPACLLC